MGSSPVAVTSTSDIAPVSSNEFMNIQAIIECGVTLKRVRDMIRIYIQINIAVSRMIWKTMSKIGVKDFYSF